MSTIMDESDSMPTGLRPEHGAIPRWLFIAHRIVAVVVLLLAVYVVLAVIAGAVLGGHSLATALVFLWHQIYTIWT